jgi:hypothetical protein
VHHAVVPQLPWPERFAVEIRAVTGTGPEIEFTVVTWLHASKAVVLASEAYRRRYPNAHIYDVVVTPLGAAPRNSNGTVDVGTDLHDRFEF